MTDSLIKGNTTSLILYELRKINETVSETKYWLLYQEHMNYSK